MMPAPTPLELVHQGWGHLRAQRPLAAWASWQRALRLRPDDEAASRAIEVLRDAVELPSVARMPQRLRPPEGEARRARWDQALTAGGLDDPAAAASAFERLVEEDETDAAAWWNLALCRAWQGGNVAAIGALDRFVGLAAESRADDAAGAWTLAELLRHGGGAEHLADELTSSFVLRRAGGMDVALRRLESRPNVVAKPAPRDPATGEPIGGDLRIFEWLDRPMPEAGAIRDARDVPRMMALVIVDPGRMRFSSPDREALAGLEGELGSESVVDRRSSPLHLTALDQGVALNRLPAGLDAGRRADLTRDLVEHHFEHRWVRQPRHGLGLRTPASVAAEAGGSAIDRARLAGIVRFYEQFSERPTAAAIYRGYPFDRLRHRLGLEPIDPNAVDPAEPACAQEPRS